MIICPNCGEIAKENVRIYDDSLKKQNIGILPVNPTCRLCGAQVVISHTAKENNIIVLNGTCGSGKTTVAEWFADKGWLAIDGDCAIQSLRHKTGQKKYEWNELIVEIAHEIDILSSFGKNIVLSHVVLPEDFEKYIKMFRTRNLKYKFVLLKPEYQTAVKRCQTRTCHENITPEQWIKHFYDLLVFDEGFEILDNTNMTAEETAEYILKIL